MDDFLEVRRTPEFLALLEERLPAKTFLHVKSVAQLMLTISEEAGITDEQAVAAGLLHDICKVLKKDELADCARRYGLTENLDNPNLLHGPVGAEMCRVELGITDEDVLDAIRYHTTGKAEWNRVGCALYFADFSETLRTIPESIIARKKLESDGYIEALLYVVGQRKSYVSEKFSPNGNSLAFFEWMVNTNLYE